LNRVCKDLFQTWLKKEAHCCLEQRGRPLILIYLGKKKQKLRIGGKESFQAQCIRDYLATFGASGRVKKLHL
jgi:hypothetical protein